MKRLDWQVLMDKKSDKKFKRYFRINKRRFCWIAGHKELKPLQSKRICAILVEIQLARTLRHLEGRALLDLEEIFKVGSNSTIYYLIPRYLSGISR